MALIDTSLVTDIHAERLSTADPTRAANCAAKAARDMESLAQMRGVSPDKIPVTEEGVATSPPLQIYGELRYLFYVMEALQGGVNRDDTYKDKEKRYDQKSHTASLACTYETIMNIVETRAASRIGSAPIW